MRKKLIPFYRKLDEQKQGYTLFLNTQTYQVYKCKHQGESETVYWFLFPLVLIVMRTISGESFYMNNPKNITIAFLFTFISVLAGVRLYKFYYKDLQEVYLTQFMIEEYIADNKGLFKKEVISILVVLLFAILFAILFLFNNKTTWLVFSLFLLFLSVFGLCELPVGRFKLYKNLDKQP